MNPALACAYGAGLYCAYAAAALERRRRSARTGGKMVPALPRATLAAMAAIALTTALQFLFPVVLTTLQRDAPRFLAGEWWRIVTPLFVEDGGVPGAVFNLVSLLLVGGAAEHRWGTARWLAIVAAGGLGGELAGLAWQPVGAGNSVVNFALAGSLALACAVRSTAPSTRILAGLSLAASLLLLALRDIHGVAALAGAAAALVLVCIGA